LARQIKDSEIKKNAREYAIPEIFQRLEEQEKVS
jgi:hypothetical protein